jgi:hypothetical protein
VLHLTMISMQNHLSKGTSASTGQLLPQGPDWSA